MALVTAGSAVLDMPAGAAAEPRRVAERALRAAAAMADGLHNASLSSLARGALGKLYEQAGRNREADRLTSEALFAAQAAPQMSFRWNWQEARLARERGDVAAALAGY